MTDITRDLRRVSVGLTRFSRNIERISIIAGFEEMTNLEADMVERTPVDIGHARKKWSEIGQRGLDLSFSLDIPYGLVLDIGSESGKKPWASPGPKTKLYKGRIFSSQVADGEGGITANVLTSQRKGEIAEKIIDRIEMELLNALGRP